MLTGVFRTDDLPTEDRFTCWRELSDDTLGATELRSAHAGDFRASARFRRLGPVRVLTIECPTLESHRTSRMIRASDPEMYALHLADLGQADVGHADRRSVLRPGELILSSTSRPNHGRLRDAGGRVRTVATLIPRALLPESAAERLLGVPLPAVDGIGGVLSRLLAHQAAPGPTGHGPADSERLGAVVLDLTTVLLNEHLDRPSPVEQHQHALLLRVHDHIRRHLADPGLSAADIAAAHHVSVRTLYRVFEREGTSLAASIREQRLDQARRSLGDPALRALSIQGIAARCGFPRPADFSRAFRARYGLSPREFRSTAFEREPGAQRQHRGGER